MSRSSAPATVESLPELSYPNFMSKLAPISWAKLVQRLHELGFAGPYAGGKHPQMSRGDLTVIIPNPHHGDIGVGLLQRILRQAGISRSECLGK
jgi:predicted RNA binding protein YcfA (HicA-like mRNA interferase family)